MKDKMRRKEIKRKENERKRQTEQASMKRKRKNEGPEERLEVNNETMNLKVVRANHAELNNVT